jgi:hypothetical protein
LTIDRNRSARRQAPGTRLKAGFGGEDCLGPVPIETVIVETIGREGPYGAKGIGRPGCVDNAPAIANAICDALGVRIKDLPISPERVLAALKERRGEPIG